MAETIQGIVLHDVDVTDGAEMASIMVKGIINISRTESNVQTSLIANADKMPKITLLKR
ncbi:hypothetical protein [Secundilactobacillus kimchicus]|uniref:hypothetical protein n=1 Tax=Secundilactobacillus kimchicus TaxID=528209 RepID=UPI0024A8FC86|nr:hypothetical protein [Secundilactobacillus kimchicus]